MKLSIVLFGLWLFCVQNVWGQKDLYRTYFSEGIENILIDANGVHSLKIEASKVEEISVSVHLEGETSEEIVIKEQVAGNQLALGFGSWPLAKIYNDKLSAHKIVSVEVTIKIPENLFVSITSNTTAVFADGSFKFLYVDIEDETCVLSKFNGEADLKTNNGSIEVSVQNSTSLAIASTLYGTLQNTLGEEGTFIISAKSIHGDITLQQTQ